MEGGTDRPRDPFCAVKQPNLIGEGYLLRRNDFKTFASQSVFKEKLFSRVPLMGLQARTGAYD